MKNSRIGYVRENREAKEYNTQVNRNLIDAFEELKQARNESIAMTIENNIILHMKKFILIKEENKSKKNKELV